MDALTTPEESKFTPTEIPDAKTNSTEKPVTPMVVITATAVVIAEAEETAVFHQLKRAPLK